MLMTPNKKINYIKEGTGKDVFLLVHGWSGNITSLTKVKDLLKEHFTVIIIDLPGRGNSDMPDSDWGVEEFANSVVSFMDSLGIDKYNYFGHSFGGALGVYIAATFPGKIDHLVLSAPSFIREPMKYIEFDKKHPLLKGFLNSYIIKRIYYKIFFPDSNIFDLPKLESNFRKVVRQDLTHLLPKIDNKTLIMWGTLDKDTPIENAYILKEGIKNSTLKIFEGYPHGFPKRIPNEVYESVMEFMNQ